MSNEIKIWDKLAEDLDGFLTAEQIRTLRKTEWDFGTPAEFALAMKQCAARDLNPFGGHVYPRQDRTKENGEWRDKMTLGVKIDGLRHLAERSGQYDGQDGPDWCDREGNWADVWLGMNGVDDGGEQRPFAAKVVIYRKDMSHPFRGIARWTDYAPHKSKQDGSQGDLFHMWDQMGAHMLAKCAEAGALRKAFSTIGNIYIDAEMEQADAPEPDEELREQYGHQTPEQQATSKQQADLNAALTSNGNDEESSQPETPAPATEPSSTPEEAESAPETSDRSEPTDGTGEPSSSSDAPTSPQEEPEKSKSSGEGSETISTGQGSQLNRLFWLGCHKEDTGYYTKDGLKLMVESEFGVDSIEELPADDFDRAQDLAEREQMAVRYNKAASGKAGTGEMFDADGQPNEPDPSDQAPDQPLTVQCPYCGAPDGEPCRTDDGDAVDYYHKDREQYAAAKAGDRDALIGRAKNHAETLVNNDADEDELRKFVADVSVEIADWPEEKWEEMVEMLEEYYEGAYEECDLRRTPEELRG